ncbi:hypothetical protein PN462_10675 [Spirulina sp. CS-785/01]|uniref:hypothetical protein n=1 Tax=Spirulina sp. CS-785/01 TaxID=3021716 RepID=UPI00232BCE3F|nr:hypothetical protein [Spirulina sp. CS-785/01]MDB9313564.1 hypothetical protein [Spirulina sp. CS-785/01]
MIPAYPVLEKPLTPSYSYSAQEWEQIFAELSALLAHPEAGIGESAIAQLIQA